MTPLEWIEKAESFVTWRSRSTDAGWIGVPELAKDDALYRSLTALRVVLDLHPSKEWPGQIIACPECATDWPCDTYMTITEALEEAS